MAPGGGSYSPLGSSFSCNVYDLPSVSTGTLSTLGVWSFELQVNDSASESVTSGSVTITVNPDLVAPTISVSPTATGSGQSATLSVITSLADGTSPYTCQWLQESPMNATFVTLGGSFTIGCTTSSKPSISTGTLTTAGNWSFELQVTDAAGETVASSPVRLTVGSLPGTSVTLSCFRSSIVVGSATTCKAKVVGSGSAPTGSVAWSSSSPGVFSRDSCALSRYGTYSTCLVRFKPTAAGSLVVLAANYGGDTNNFPSSGAYNLTVTMKVMPERIFHCLRQREERRFADVDRAVKVNCVVPGFHLPQQAFRRILRLCGDGGTGHADNDGAKGGPEQELHDG